MGTRAPGPPSKDALSESEIIEDCEESASDVGKQSLAHECGDTRSGMVHRWPWDWDRHDPTRPRLTVNGFSRGKIQLGVAVRPQETDMEQPTMQQGVYPAFRYTGPVTNGKTAPSAR